MAEKPLLERGKYSANIDDRRVNTTNALREMLTLNNGRMIPPTAFTWAYSEGEGYVLDNLSDPVAMADQAPEEFDRIDDIAAIINESEPRAEDVLRAMKLPRSSHMIGDPGGLVEDATLSSETRPERIALVQDGDEVVVARAGGEGHDRGEHYGRFMDHASARSYAARLLAPRIK